MRLVSNTLLTVSGFYLALGFIYLRVWLSERKRFDYLAFTLSCLAVTLFSWFELGMMHSQTPEEFFYYSWPAFLIGVLVSISVASFAYLHLHGRRWLFLSYCALRLSGAVVHFLSPNGINFREITSIGHISVLGETLSFPIAVPNPWMILAHLAHLVLIIFCLDASFRTWRRGEQRKASIFGLGVVLFGIAITIVSVGVLWGLVRSPFLASFSIFFIITAMLYELNYDMHKAAMIAEKLEERDAELSETVDQLQLSAAAGSVGLWTRKIGEDKIWISKKAGEIWGFTGGETFTREDFFQSIHPEDRQQVLNMVNALENQKDEFHLEYRVFRRDGNIRWVDTQGRVEQLNGTRIIRGAIVDVTKRKMTEEAIHELSRKLMNAQEKERARLARELHDDLSQSLALLSIQLSQLRKAPMEADYLNNQVDQLVSAIARLSADVHRISHELHPAKLSQLGLELALRGFCRELTSAHPIKIDLNAENIPRMLPDDISLALYRVTQESLQNVIKHSGATDVHVSIKLENDEIRLGISDNGSGFDPKLAAGKESLGLISIDERVRAIKGTVNIISSAGAGTKIEVFVPYKQAV